jgi:hypothetical protein
MEQFIQDHYHYYIRVLAFNRASRFLSDMNQNSKLTLISKLSDYYTKATGPAKLMLQKNIECDHLYRLIQMNHRNETLPTEFEQKILIQ